MNADQKATPDPFSGGPGGSAGGGPVGAAAKRGFLRPRWPRYHRPMSSNLTPQQSAAVGHRGSSVVLASGAGCGKTHVLTARYLSHLTADAAEVGQVVAITFTDRAAREMRDRIRAAVARLPDAARHLRDLETAPVATIHSFCGSLLRQFAVPAGLDPGFEVLDDILAANLRTDGLNGCLQGLLVAGAA